MIIWLIKLMQEWWDWSKIHLSMFYAQLEVETPKKNYIKLFQTADPWYHFYAFITYEYLYFKFSGFIHSNYRVFIKQLISPIFTNSYGISFDNHYTSLLSEVHKQPFPICETNTNSQTFYNLLKHEVNNHSTTSVRERKRTYL